ncbi:MAG: ABC transporter permease [Rikenellaceae bacterium]|nr:ABC transporter permease [Rikenellaceae bacterium]
MLTLRFARRYLFSPKSHSVINLISGVSLVAVAMPVAAMIILLSVFNGFEGLIRQMATAFDADLVITPREGVVFPVERIDTAALGQLQGIEGCCAVVEHEALVGYGESRAMVTVRGVEDHYGDLFPIREAMVTGEYVTRLGDYDKAVIGQGLSYRLGLRSPVGAPLKLYALRQNSFSSLLPIDGYTMRELPLSGTFSLDAESEERYLLTSIRLACELFGMEQGATALLLKCGPEGSSQRLKAQVQEAVGEQFEVRTRYELRQTFYDIMTYEKWGIFFISILVVVVASFSIVGALAMLIIEKRDEQLTLRSLGADTSFIRRIFLGEGLLIGGIGALLGTLLGVGITLAQQYIGLVEMPVASFVMQYYPVEFRLGDLVAVWVVLVVVVWTIAELTVRSMISKS